jgi:chromate transport protein ChrA
MASTTAHPRHSSPFRPFDRAVERILGADMRLLYGMAVPVILLSVLIALGLGYAASPWMVGVLMLLEAALLGVVMIGLMGMMDSRDDDER